MSREATQFRKGRSGNPGGRPKVVAEVRELAQRHTVEAIDALAKICRSGRSEGARVAAATALLDRGYGRPHQSIHTTSRTPPEISDAELMAIVAAEESGPAGRTL